MRVDYWWAWHVIFLDIRLFDSPFLPDTGGEEQDDGLLGYIKASTAYFSHGKLELLHNRLQQLDLCEGFVTYNHFPSGQKQLFQ